MVRDDRSFSVTRRHFGTVRRRASGRWQAVYWQDGRYVSAGSFATKADAQARLSEVEVSIRRGNWVDPRSGSVTLSHYSRQWLENRPELAVRTLDLYKFILERHVLPVIGARQLSTIKASEIRKWHAELSRRTPATAAKAYRLLSTIMRTAVTDELISTSPCRVKGAGVERSPERPIASVGEVQALAQAMPPHLRIVVPLATWCQMRRGELLGLQRQDVDVANSTIHVRRSRTFALDGSVVEKAPKTAAGVRHLVVPLSVVADLEAHMRDYCGSERAAYVLVNREGDPLTRNSLEAAWKTARKRVGRPDLRLHDLRHTGLTYAAAAGATTAELMHRAGHASAAAALRYQHVIQDRDRALADALEVISQGSDRLRDARGSVLDDVGNVQE